MSFHEVRFPTAISLASSGGPERRTDIVVLGSGHEERNARWEASRRRYDAGYGIKTQGPEAAIETLSGGNVQRTVLARELAEGVRVLVVQNPCFGLDLNAVAEIRNRIMAARNAGAAVLLVSEDLDEILELSDRILVMFEGRIVFETKREKADVHEIGRYMASHN